VKSLIKTYSKKVIIAVEEKNPQGATQALREVVPIFQKASAKGSIHKRTAARRISRLTKKVNAIFSPGPTAEKTPSQ